MRQFGQGIVDILNKEKKCSDPLEDQYSVCLEKNKNTVVLDID